MCAKNGNYAMPERVVFYDCGTGLQLDYRFDPLNTMLSLRKAYAQFLRHWLSGLRLGRKPGINLVFLGPDGQWFFVLVEGERRKENRTCLLLTRKAMAVPLELVRPVLEAYVRCAEAWNEWEQKQEESGRSRKGLS